MMEKGLLEKTGKSLKHWKAVLKKSKLEKHGEMVSYLKSDHGFTHGFANFVALMFREADAGSHDGHELVNQQYAGAKQQLKPIYLKLLKTVGNLGDDIEVVPKKDSVSIRRKYQFALIKPATRTRIDLGLKLKGVKVGGRLEGSGPFGSMCTHRVQLQELSDVDTEVGEWLKLAYDKSI